MFYRFFLPLFFFYFSLDLGSIPGFIVVEKRKEKREKRKKKRVEIKQKTKR
jgi:hypothetical protein